MTSSLVRVARSSAAPPLSTRWASCGSGEVSSAAGTFGPWEPVIVTPRGIAPASPVLSQRSCLRKRRESDCSSGARNNSVARRCGSVESERALRFCCQRPAVRSPIPGWPEEVRMSVGRATTANATPSAHGRVLVVTGHFPPAPGGVQTFTWEMLRRMPADRLVVVAPAHPEAAAFDAELDFPVLRRRADFLIRDLRRIVADYDITSCWIPAVAPIGLAAPFVRRAGVRRIVGSTHGQELGWLRAWPTRRALRRMIGALDAVTYLSAYTAEHLLPVVDHPERMFQLVGGVDTEIFRAGAADARARERLGLPGGRTVISVARLVRRKGHDMVISAWPRVLEAVPDAKLVIP